MKLLPLPSVPAVKSGNEKLFCFFAISPAGRPSGACSVDVLRAITPAVIHGCSELASPPPYPPTPSPAAAPHLHDLRDVFTIWLQFSRAQL